MATVKMKHRDGGEIVVDESIARTLSMQGYSRADGKDIGEPFDYEEETPESEPAEEPVDDGEQMDAPRGTGTGAATGGGTRGSRSRGTSTSS